MSKSLLQTLFLIFLIASPVSTKKIHSLPAHETNIGDLKINEILEKIIPKIDVHRPLEDVGSLIGRGGRAISPGLGKAGKISTAVGVVFINIGTLLLTLSQLLSSQGAIGGNPNFLNDALSSYLATNAALNIQNNQDTTITIPGFMSDSSKGELQGEVTNSGSSSNQQGESSATVSG